MHITIATRKHTQLVDITPEVQRAVTDAAMDSGLVHVFSLHTTAGITINENADPDVRTDIISSLDTLFPWNGNYRHMEGNSAAHLKTSFMGPSQWIPIEKGTLVLGTWQSVFLCEFDGPRTRRVHLTFIHDHRFPHLLTPASPLKSK